MKKTLALFCLILLLSACGAPDVAETGGLNLPGIHENVELTVFADSSLTDVLQEIAGRYYEIAPWAQFRFQFGSSGDLSRRIRDGDQCDIFLSAAAAPMDALDGHFRGDAERNPDGLDLLWEESRVEFAENEVVMAVPVGNPQGIRDFAHASAVIRRDGALFATACPGDPLGACAERIFNYYFLDNSVAARGFTRTSDAREAVTRIRSGMADGGILYRTDAEGLEVIDAADASICGESVCCAAVLAESPYPLAASAFLEYLTGGEALDILTRAGFSPPSEEGEYWEAALPEESGDWRAEFPEEPGESQAALPEEPGDWQAALWSDAAQEGDWG